MCQLHALVPPHGNAIFHGTSIYDHTKACGQALLLTTQVRACALAVKPVMWHSQHRFIL